MAFDYATLLPRVRGKYRYDVSLKDTSWFRVGGTADVVFKPEDLDDLQHFLQQLPQEVPVTILGACSNVIVRDGGVRGVLIRLGRNFAAMEMQDSVLHCGAAALDVNVAEFAAQNTRAGLEFLSGIPGSIGGAVAMNAGAYDSEMKQVLRKVRAIDREGNIHDFDANEMGLSYRHCGLAGAYFFVEAWLQTEAGERKDIVAKMQEVNSKREATQPTKTRTGGSTFANPDGQKAWQLIDDAGCRGMQVGGAKMSEKHCNFMENCGDATAKDLEELGEQVRQKVQEQAGVRLHWEIKRVGQK